MIIALDGFSGSGKGTLGKKLASFFNFAYLDTGLLYRALGWKMLNMGADLHNEAQALQAALSIDLLQMNEQDLRNDQVATAASIVSKFLSVRNALLGCQRAFATFPYPDNKAGVILDGRDIGTVVCPDADWKFFITADIAVRATRRLNELQSIGSNSIHENVLRDMQERDNRDQQRADSPCLAASDAIVVDTSKLTADQVLEYVLQTMRAKT